MYTTKGKVSYFVKGACFAVNFNKVERIYINGRTVAYSQASDHDADVLDEQVKFLTAIMIRTPRHISAPRAVSRVKKVQKQPQERLQQASCQSGPLAFWVSVQREPY
ncbi:TPA: hypothetical protein SMI27_005199 [Serratia liquefaciens]|nr:hypothetical protein [Serratia liquefaciens]